MITHTGKNMENKELDQLRDLFAGMALVGLLANPKMQPYIMQSGGARGGWVEESAYAWADGMLVEKFRGKGNEVRNP